MTDTEECLVFTGLRTMPYRISTRPGELLFLWRNQQGNAKIAWVMKREANETVLRVFDGRRYVSDEVEDCFETEEYPKRG